MNAIPPVAQNPDVRFLGKLLGDVIRAYGGEKLFKRIEYIRSASVDRHRGVADADAIDPGLHALTLDDTLSFVRGFMLFSMLANLAEDRQGVATEPEADVAHAIERLRGEGVTDATIAELLKGALIAPVLTAHPTEVRRSASATVRPVKSMMLIPSTVTARNSGLSRLPAQAGHGFCIISRSMSCLTHSDSVSR